jgi:PTH1 family peptidyl-tRNA hydrolase
VIVDSFCLIVGLGNPGSEYAKTRHNIGFRILETLAKENGVEFQKKRDFKAEVAKFTAKNKQALLLKPTTYMNLSGEAVRKCLDFYKIGTESMLIVVDDVDMPFGQLRLRSQGSSGGHNGLKSIEFHTGSKVYYRLKIGVGRQVGTDVADHVLGAFTHEEEEKLGSIVDQAVKVLSSYIAEGYTGALNALAQLKPLNA